MTEEPSRNRAYWVLGLVILLGIVLVVFFPTVSALKIGETPTPTPTPPTPTPRIIYKTVIVTPTTIPTPEPTVLPGKGLINTNAIYVYQILEGSPGMVFIPRSDAVVISRTYPNSSKPEVHKEAHFWLFGVDGTYDQMLDHEVTVDDRGFYHVSLSPVETSGLSPGKYIALVQFAGDNGKMDVTYSPIHERFESIYISGTPTSIAGDTGSKIYQKLLWMLNNKAWSDDTYEEFTLIAEDPWVSIDDVTIDNGIIDLRGATNLGIYNDLSIILDEDKIVTELDREKSTKKLAIQAYTDYRYPRNIWSLNFSTAGMYPGKHTVTLIAPKFGSVTTSSFEIRESWPAMTPTPTPVRYITGFPELTPVPPVPGSSGFGVIPISTVPTPTTIRTTPPTPEPTEIITTAPTPVPTTKPLLLNAKGDSPLGTSLKAMPLDPIIGILALLGAFMVMKRE